jgi:hypothetical protein
MRLKGMTAEFRLEGKIYGSFRRGRSSKFPACCARGFFSHQIEYDTGALDTAFRSFHNSTSIPNQCKARNGVAGVF